MDLGNVNGEYARILNQGTRPLSLTGWWMRSAAQNSYVFPRGTVVQPGATLTLRVGTGRNTSTTRYWGQPSAIFRNVDTAEGFGNGVYLFDPDGDLRAHAIYPYLFACGDPLLGKVTMAVNINAPGLDPGNPNGEYVAVAPHPGCRRPVVQGADGLGQHLRAAPRQRRPAGGAARGPDRQGAGAPG